MMDEKQKDKINSMLAEDVDLPNSNYYGTCTDRIMLKGYPCAVELSDDYGPQYDMLSVEIVKEDIATLEKALTFLKAAQRILEKE